MTNAKPEKLVEVEILAFGKRHGFDLTVVDTSAVWNPQANRYLSRMASESLPDLIGNWNSVSVWIELKARGCRSVINSKACSHQLQFIIRKINQGCFACVTDSSEHLNQLCMKFKNAKDLAERRAVLMNDLPRNRQELALERAAKVK